PLAVGPIAVTRIPLRAHEAALPEHGVDALGIPIQPERQVIRQGLVGLGMGGIAGPIAVPERANLRTMAAGECALELRLILVRSRRSRSATIAVGRYGGRPEDRRTQRGKLAGALFNGGRRAREMLARDGEVPPVGIDLDGPLSAAFHGSCPR